MDELLSPTVVQIALWTWDKLFPGGRIGGHGGPGGRLRKIYHKMLSYLGVNRNIKAEWRHLHTSFGGVGLRKLLTEVVIACINLFIQHYNTPSTLGKKLTISLEALQLEVGSDRCPLLIPYCPLGLLATLCWCRSFWESLDYYKFKLELDYDVLQLPREGDVLLIDIFLRANTGQEVLLSLQRCMIKWKAMFLSDLIASNGRQIERRFLSVLTSKDGSISSLGFAMEHPSP